MTSRRTPRSGRLTVALIMGLSFAALALVLAGCGTTGNVTGSPAGTPLPRRMLSVQPGGQRGRRRRPGAGHRPESSGAAREGRRSGRGLPHDRAVRRCRRLDAAAHDHGLQRHHGRVVAAVRRGAGAGARGRRLRQPRDRRDATTPAARTVLAARRRHRRVHQGARLRQDGRPRWSMGGDVALDLAVRHPQVVDRLVSYAGDAGGQQAVPMSKETLAVLTDTSGTAEQRGMRLLTLLFPPAYRRADPAYAEASRSRPSRRRLPRSPCRTGPSGSGRAFGAASRASRRRPCSSPAPKM